MYILLALCILISSLIIFIVHEELTMETLDLTRVQARWLLIPLANIPFAIILLAYFFVKNIPAFIKGVWEKTRDLP